MLQYESKHSLEAELTFLGDRNIFLLRLSNDWMMSTHIMEDNLLKSMFTNLNI